MVLGQQGGITTIQIKASVPPGSQPPNHRSGRVNYIQEMAVASDTPKDSPEENMPTSIHLIQSHVGKAVPWPNSCEVYQRCGGCLPARRREPQFIYTAVLTFKIKGES